MLNAIIDRDPGDETQARSDEVGDIIRVTKSGSLGGIMEGNEYLITHIHEPGFITVSNGVFVSSLDSRHGDQWINTGEKGELIRPY